MKTRTNTTTKAKPQWMTREEHLRQQVLFATRLIGWAVDELSHAKIEIADVLGAHQILIGLNGRMQADGITLGQACTESDLSFKADRRSGLFSIDAWKVKVSSESDPTVKLPNGRTPTSAPKRVMYSELLAASPQLVAAEKSLTELTETREDGDEMTEAFRVYRDLLVGGVAKKLGVTLD